MTRPRTILVLALPALLLLVVSAGAQTAPDTRAAALIGLARVRHAEGNESAAADLFRQADRRTTFDDGLLEEWFWSEVAGSPNAALPVAERLLTMAPGRSGVRQRALDAAFATGALEVAERLAGGGAALESSWAAWSRALARVADARQDPALAYTRWLQVVARGGVSPDDLSSLATAAMASGHPADALEAWRRIPAAARDANADWSRQYVEVLAATGDAATAARAFSTRVNRHGDAPATRAQVVDALARAEHYGEALDLIGPLLRGADRTHWLSRAVEFAVADGDPRRIIDAVSQVERTARLSADQLAWRASARLRIGRTDDARADIRLLRQTAPACDDRALRLLEETGDGHALADVILSRPAACPDNGWRQRTASYLLGEGDESRLLSLIDPSRSDELPVGARLGYARALSRSGRVDDAVTLLEGLLQRDSDSPEQASTARAALIDLHLAGGRLAAAWSLVVPALAREELPAGDVLERWLRTGIAVGRAAEVLMFVVAREPGDRTTLASVEASALAARGRYAEAIALFSSLAPDTFGPEGALAYVDATTAAAGSAGARALAATLDRTTPAWIDVTARRALLAAREGDDTEAGRLQAVISNHQPTRGRLLDAEIALAEGRPDAALDALKALPESARDDRRVLELRGAAHEARHDWPSARAAWQAVRLLSADPMVAVREADAAWHETPGNDTLDTLIAAAREADAPDARLRASSALRAVGRPDDALTVFGQPAAWRRLDPVSRSDIATTLVALGRDSDALQLLSDDTDATSAGLLRAALTARLAGVEPARPLFESLVRRGASSPATWVRWGQAESGERRTAVLARGLAALPASVDLLLASAEDARRRGAGVDARRWLADARTHAPDRLDVWTASFDLALREGRDADARRWLDDASRALDEDGRLALVRHLTGLASDLGPRVSDRLLAWTDEMVTRRPSGDTWLTRARLRAARHQWQAADADVERAIADPATERDARRLKADLLSYAGDYDASFAAYRLYLQRYPDDVETARQLARVYGWAQHVAAARENYRALIAAYPTDARLRAEFAAKDALFDGRWTAARAAYAIWMAMEPENQEAAFEAAQVARAAGDESAATHGAVTLASQQPAHRQSLLALESWNSARKPGLQPFATTHDASGEGGRRTLTLDERGLTGGGWLGQAGRAWLGLRATRIEARGTAFTSTGARVAAALGLRAGASTFDARIGALVLGDHRTPAVDAGARLAVTDRVAVLFRATRDGWLENATTARTGLVSTDIRGGAALSATRWSAEGTVLRRAFSDGNSGWQVEGTGRRQLATGRTEWHAFTWLSRQQHAREADDYFAPRSFTRADVGLEWRTWLSRPRFRDDRDRSLTVTYAIGTDSRQFVYHHPSVRFAHEFRPGIALEARGSWLRSPEYRATDVLVALRIGGSAPGTASPAR